MSRFVVTGGNRLFGVIRVSGAKNAVLPILAATLLTDDEVALADCPILCDVWNMLGILEALGVKAKWQNGLLCIDASNADSYIMPQGLSKELRSSIFMLGPLLARFGKAVCTFPGGCEIGNRPIDLHLRGLTMLGAKIREEYGLIKCECDGELIGTDIHLDYPSVGATENIMMAAVSAKGKTVILNAAREPEIEDLERFLVMLGYDVAGAGTSTIEVVGGKSQKHGDLHRIIPDRIVTGTLMCAAAISGGRVKIENVVPIHIGSVSSKLKEAGCIVESGNDWVSVDAPQRLREIKLIETLPYPGFPTDMQAQFFSILTIADGTSVIVENVFENRFKHGAELLRMGASFTQKDRTTIIRGVRELSGTQIVARDLRGGAALTLAGLAARGETSITGADIIDRGYERLDEMLCNLGADVRREEDVKDV